jgi:translocation protein SEC63
VIPNALVNLVVRLRISPPSNGLKDEKPAAEEKYDDSFLSGRKDAEDLTPEDAASIGYAHAPFWHTVGHSFNSTFQVCSIIHTFLSAQNRKPSWWLFVADERGGKIVVPPTKITDVPYSKHARAYRLQFQATFGPQTYPWKMFLISDTFVGEEIVRDLPVS